MQTIPIPGGTISYARGWERPGNFARLAAELDWESRGAPRAEYFCSDVGADYAYGTGAGRRVYSPRPWHPLIRECQEALQNMMALRFEVCFLNYYRDEREALGWHADDSPEMDDTRPIAVVSFGATRDLHFRRKGQRTSEAIIPMSDGDLLMMPAGMQDTHDHRVAKASCHGSQRISMTFRGYVAPGS